LSIPYADQENVMSISIANQIVQLLPPGATSDSSGAGMARGWFKTWLLGRRRVRTANKPDWIYVPDRVWRRQSALIMCLHESRYPRDDHG
jgi:hypothetical protein